MKRSQSAVTPPTHSIFTVPHDGAIEAGNHFKVGASGHLASGDR